MEYRIPRDRKVLTNINLDPDQRLEVEMIAQSNRIAVAAVCRQLIDEALSARKRSKQDRLDEIKEKLK